MLRQSARCAVQAAGRAAAARTPARSLVTQTLADLPGTTKYGGVRTVTLIPGDGIGQELCKSVRAVLTAMGAPVHFEEVDFRGLDSDVDLKMQEAIYSLRRNGVGLKGIIETPQGFGSKQSINMQLRLQLDLFANVVTIKSQPGIPARHKDVDLVVIRQNTEGEYSNLEHEISPGVVESLKVISREESLRIAKFAFDYAVQKGRSKVTAVHKANIMKQGDGLFLQCCSEVAQLYPRIAYESMIVDNTSMQMVGRPQQFDVLVTPNLYGNITGNIGAGLIGGAGLVPGVNYSNTLAVFEPGARHVGGDIAGKNKANPTAMLYSSALMLNHLGLNIHAVTLNQAIKNTLSAGKVLTSDLGGSASTEEFTSSVIEEIDRVRSGEA